MKNLFLLITLICFTITSKGQDLDFKSHFNLFKNAKKTGDIDNAIFEMKKCIEIHETNSEIENSELATLISELANLYFYIGKFEDVLYLNEEALRIRIKVLGEDHPDVALSFNNLAVFFTIWGNLKRQFHYMKKQ